MTSTDAGLATSLSLTTGGPCFNASTFAPHFLELVGLTLGFGLAPYAPLSPLLFGARREGAAAYSALGRRYIAAFDAKWIVGKGETTPLGTPDLQSLADLGSSFSVIDEMRISVFSTRKALRLLLAAVVPALLLVLFQMSAAEVARRVFELVL